MTAARQPWRGGESARGRRFPGDRIRPCTPEVEDQWGAFMDAAVRLAGDPAADPAELIRARQETRHLPRPGNDIGRKAVGVFLEQADLYVMVPPRARREFARLLHDAAVQARRVAIGAPPDSLRHPSLGKVDS